MTCPDQPERKSSSVSAPNAPCFLFLRSAQYEATSNPNGNATFPYYVSFPNPANCTATFMAKANAFIYGAENTQAREEVSPSAEKHAARSRPSPRALNTARPGAAHRLASDCDGDCAEIMRRSCPSPFCLLHR